MDVAGSRFADLVGPHCIARECNAPVVVCLPKMEMFDAEPHPEGAYRLSDQGGARPFALHLHTAQQFNYQGKLHRRHASHCEKYKRTQRRG